VVRARGAAAPLVSAIRARLAEIDQNQPVYGVRTVEQVMAGSLAPWRLYSSLLGAFAGLAAVLAALGIHAVIAGSVAERRHEIGIRMALGAGRGDVLALVFRQAMSLVVIGIVLGLVGAQAATQSIRGWLFGISAHDPLTYGLVCVGIMLLAALAALRPARQATAVDPVVALRSE
jgi:putative ABC transport system permease protein